jgi:GNAT superfamily N-acetyltransferase
MSFPIHPSTFGTMPAVSLQIINRNDPAYDAVWALREEILRKPLGLSLHNEDLSAEVAETTIAATGAGGVVLGCVMLKPLDTKEIKLRQMAVALQLQGKGIGNQLLNRAEEFARSAGFQLISLHARLSAVPFYEKSGYMIEGEVFTEVGVPHLLMNKMLYEALP